MRYSTSHWVKAGLTFLLTLLGAAILLPLARVRPETVHNYFNGLQTWVRVGFVFFLSVSFTAGMFNLLSPRIGDITLWKSHPPAWLASLLAWLVVACVDISWGFPLAGYRATVCEWLGYGAGSLLIIAWYSGLWLEVAHCIRKPTAPKPEKREPVRLQDIPNAPWGEIETWLESNAPAQYDFLGNSSIASRVVRLLSSVTRSVGIVGPFGSGRTSLVKWVIDGFTSSGEPPCRYFTCHHSCWGFETSASAIEDMLKSAIVQLSAVVDTFQVESLPDSYRQAFSAGGDWATTLSNILIRKIGPLEQFGRLSQLLEDIGGRIIFIVEDLDRNETGRFEILEVLAFLERLKRFPRLSFILTGGLSSTRRIDYSKLCDHIEYLKTVQPEHASELIKRVSQRCLDPALFPHIRIADPSHSSEWQWNELTEMLVSDYEELSLPQAVASLLNTPRSLRHALGHTFAAWHTLYGEIDFNHLLAVNVLRFGAPEAFLFLIQ